MTVLLLFLLPLGNENETRSWRLFLSTCRYACDALEPLHTFQCCAFFINPLCLILISALVFTSPFPNCCPGAALLYSLYSCLVCSCLCLCPLYCACACVYVYVNVCALPLLFYSPLLSSFANTSQAADAHAHFLSHSPAHINFKHHSA